MASCVSHRKLYRVNGHQVSCGSNVAGDLSPRSEIQACGESNGSTFSQSEQTIGNSNKLQATTETGSQADDDHVRVCTSNICRTKWQTGSLTLACHYCEIGWLVNYKDKAYACVFCNKTFKSLEFIERQVVEQLDLFRFWFDDLKSKSDHPRSSLNMMTTYHQQLVNILLGPGNIRLVELALDMADAHRLLDDQHQIVEYLQQALKLLVDYELKFVADLSKPKQYLERLTAISHGKDVLELLPENYLDQLDLLSERIRCIFC